MNHPRKLFLNYRNNLLMLYKNLSPSAWKKVYWQRNILDFMAMVVFALKGEWKNVRSVGKAYQEFRKMKKAYRSAKEQGEDRCIYQGSIIFQYYFRKVRKFSDL